MAIVRLDPFREIDTLQREMNRLFSDVFPTTRSHTNNGLSGFSPAAELEETAEAYHLRLEIPGIKSEDLDIQVTAEAVSVSGERKSESKSEQDGVTRSEFYYGSFQRIVPLPGRINNQQVKADYRDGILTLDLPKAEEEKNKVVKVNLAQLSEV